MNEVQDRGSASMDWQDYVLAGDRGEFLERERAYTKHLLDAFHGAEGDEREILRAKVLAKRLEFLADWLEEKALD